MGKLKTKLPGLILAILIGLIGMYLSNWIPNLGGVTLAIILGFLIGNFFNLDETYNSGIRFAEKKILALAIMLMGLKLQLNVLAKLGFSSLLIIVIMVLTTVTVGFLIGRLVGLSKSFSILLGVGNGICGSSAIAAAAPIISDNEEEIGLSVSVVNLLGTIGIFILPFITYLLKLTEATSGLMIGSTLQATGQVVAAGFSVSDVVGKVATIVKMGRILMLGPVILFLSLTIGKKDNNCQSKVSVPPFIIGFFILSIVGTMHLLPNGVTEFFKAASEFLLIIAMAGIGLKIRVNSLANQGPKSLAAGVLIFVTQILVITGLVLVFFK